MTAERIPPQAIDAEMAVLGACLCDREIIGEIAGIVSPQDFYAQIHECILEAILRLHSDSAPVDKISVFESMRARGDAEKAGGISYLSSLMDTVQTANSAVYYAKIVREKSLLRGLISAGSRIVDLGYDGEVEVADALAKADSVLRSTTERGVRADDGVRAYDSTISVMRALDEGRNDAQFTPWPLLNDFTGGFFPGELILWAAAPGMGKTGASINLADYVAARHGSVLYFSLEMSVHDISRRMLAMYSRVPARAMRRGDLSPHQFDQLGEVLGTVAEQNIRYFGRPKSCADIRAALSRATRTTQPKAIVIDHIGFLDDVTMRPPRTSQHEALERVYASLLSIGAEFQVVIHAIQHVNRDGQQQDSEGTRYKKPGLSDIRGGGNAEGMSHVIIFPYRPRPAGTPEEQREGYFILAKNRDGEAGQIAMTYLGARHLWLCKDEIIPWFERESRQSAAEREVA